MSIFPAARRCSARHTAVWNQHLELLRQQHKEVSMTLSPKEHPIVTLQLLHCMSTYMAWQIDKGMYTE